MEKTVQERTKNGSYEPSLVPRAVNTHELAKCVMVPACETLEIFEKSERGEDVFFCKRCGGFISSFGYLILLIIHLKLAFNLHHYSYGYHVFLLIIYRDSVY